MNKDEFLNYLKRKIKAIKGYSFKLEKEIIDQGVPFFYFNDVNKQKLITLNGIIQEKDGKYFTFYSKKIAKSLINELKQELSK